MNNQILSPQFFPGQNVISIVNHSPEIKPGTSLTIEKPWYGNLCAVELPNGEIHRWIAWFELSPEGINLTPGSYTTVINSNGHGYPPKISVGMKVKIVKCIPTYFYDSILNNGEYHRWLAEFELANPI